MTFPFKCVFKNLFIEQNFLNLVFSFGKWEKIRSPCWVVTAIHESTKVISSSLTDQTTKFPSNRSVKIPTIQKCFLFEVKSM